MRPYAVYKSNGRLWPATRSVWGLCSAYNHATSPGVYMTEAEHARSRVYARAILNRLRRLGLRYRELPSGLLWPLK